MNLSIKVIDKAVRSTWLKTIDPARLGVSLTPKRRNFAYVAVWACVFATLSAFDGVGDDHPGHTVPFWQQACLADGRNACSNLAIILDTYCGDGSGWACNEVGVLRWHGRAAGAERVGDDFSRACALGFAPGCLNVTVATRGSPPRQGRPQLADYPVILRTGKGALPDTTPLQLFTRACDQGWLAGCEGMGGIYLQGQGATRDAPRAAAAFGKACDAGLATSCSNLGLMYYSADGVPGDEQKGLNYLRKACDLGFANACRWVKETPSKPVSDVR